MTKEQADKAVVTSAFIVFGIYFYRHLTEGTTTSNGGTKQLIGFGTPANLGKFVTAWGFVFLGLSIVSDISPGFGGSFAILVAVSDLLTNLGQVAKDINTKLGSTSSPIGGGYSALVSGNQSGLPSSAPTSTPIIAGVGNRNAGL